MHLRIDVNGAARDLNLPWLERDDQIVTLNSVTGSLALFGAHGLPHPIIGIERFTEREMQVLAPMLTLYPYQAPVGMLLAHRRSPSPSLKEIKRASLEVLRARHIGTYLEVVRPLREVLSPARTKLLRLGVDIYNVLGQGYVLAILPQIPPK